MLSYDLDSNICSISKDKCKDVDKNETAANTTIFIASTRMPVNCVKCKSSLTMDCNKCYYGKLNVDSQ